MKVLAIDPGYDRIGLAVMEAQQGKEVLLFSTCFETDREATLPKRMLALGQEVETLLRTFQPDAVALETLFFNKNIKTALSVAEARGVIIYLAQVAKCTLYEFSPQQIKVAVTGHGQSDKKAVISMVKRLIAQAPKAALDDEYDAIAVGITCLAHYR